MINHYHKTTINILLRAPQYLMRPVDKKAVYLKLKAIAEGLGGRVVSAQYLNSSQKMEFSCRNESHPNFFKYSREVVKGQWCPYCSGAARDKTWFYNKLKDIANQKGGEIISSEFVDSGTKLEFSCANPQHPTFLKLPREIRKGKWCPHCYQENKNYRREEVNNQKYEEIKKCAETRGGRLLSAEYVDTTTALEFACAEKGHPNFFRSPAEIGLGRWCPHCAVDCNNRTWQYNLIKQIADQKGGRVICPKYTNNLKNMEFSCEVEGHPNFWLAPLNVKLGSWCRLCNDDSGENSR